VTNAQIADIFEQMADLLEFEGANVFRIRAYRNGARAISGLAESIKQIIEDEDRKLTDIKGIGKDLAAKCETLVETGGLPALNELKAKIPESALAMLRVRGLGPKTAAKIFNALGVKDLDELEAACKEKRIREIKGLSGQTEAMILDGLAFARASGERMLLSEADTIAQALLAHMESCESIERIALAGSYRRGKETVGDLDLLVVTNDYRKVFDHFMAYSPITERLEQYGDFVSASVVVHGKIQVDLRVVRAESYGAAMQFFTGSKEHNIHVRDLARQRGMRINEHGVYDADGNHIAGTTEAEVYATLDLPYFEPEMRENRFEFGWAELGELPELVTLDDIRGDLHMHTIATDGKNTIREMVDAAIARGLSYIAITDHSHRVAMANGLDPERLLQQWAEIDEINKELASGPAVADGEARSDRASFTVLKGIECDILESGELDLPDDVLAQADWVLAAVHYGIDQPRQQITDRIVGALENPYVSAIAHPTGRLLNHREPYPVDLEQVFAAAKEHGKMLELNAHPSRLDLNDVLCASAKHHGIPIVINTDAHSIDGLDVMKYGIKQARRAGLTKADVANTRTTWTNRSV